MKNKNHITDKDYWDKYWNNYQYNSVPKKVVFERFMPLLMKGKSFIDIGGFPGVFAAYFHQKGITEVTILDFHIRQEIVHRFEEINGLAKGTIRCIESDFFNYAPDRTYDVVFSSGFIEHFEDTRDVIARHVNLLSKEGQLLLLVPNFLGLNGKLQQWFDQENLAAHNLQSMKIPYLQEIMKTFDFRHVTVEYTGKPMLWLEPKPQNLGKRKWVKLFSYAAKLFPFKGKFLSPFIVIYATK